MSQAAPAGLAPTGVLRVGINLGNPLIAQRNPTGGDPRGVGPALGRELARRAGVSIRFVQFDTAGLMADAAKLGAWDVAFLAIDPARATDIDFTDAYALIEGAYMVPNASPLQTVIEVDREGIRIAVGLKTAYDLYLTREIKHAELVRAPSSLAAIDLFLAEKLEVVAGVRQPLQAAAREHAGLRLLDESFMVIRQASGVPRGRAEARAYLSAFIEEAKASGFVERELKQSGVTDVSVAPVAAAQTDT